MSKPILRAFLRTNPMIKPTSPPSARSRMQSRWVSLMAAVSLLMTYQYRLGAILPYKPVSIDRMKLCLRDAVAQNNQDGRRMGKKAYPRLDERLPRLLSLFRALRENGKNSESGTAAEMHTSASQIRLDSRILAVLDSRDMGIMSRSCMPGWERYSAWIRPSTT